jgi:hypothetical protein
MVFSFEVLIVSNGTSYGSWSIHMHEESLGRLWLKVRKHEDKMGKS